MSGMSRRALLQATAGAAALAAVPMSALSSGAAAATRATAGGLDAEAAGLDAGAKHAGPVMFCVHDAARGEVSVMHGANEVIVRDRQLVARIMQAASRRSV